MNSGSLTDSLASTWWLVILRGIIAIFFGFSAFAMPGITIVSLVWIYGIYVLGDGIAAIWAGGSIRAWGLLLSGVLSLIVGIYCFVFPGSTAIALIHVFAFWSVVRGILEIIAAVRVRKEIDNEWMLVLGGLLSIAVGIILFFNPATAAIGMVWLIALYAMAYGVSAIILGIRIRGLSGAESGSASSS